MSITLIILMIMFSMIFLFMNHPLSFGLILLLNTCIISLISGLMNYNYWYSYILFLIMIGSMLILFIYMTSIASNEKFKFSNKMLNIMKLSLLMIFFMMILDTFYMDNLMIMEIINQNIFIYPYLSLMKYLNFPNYLILITIIIYLFITLIMVVKITSIGHGPLRQKH
nr:NADH dehydrogenase subunit 6 [Syneta adamsi]